MKRSWIRFSLSGECVGGTFEKLLRWVEMEQKYTVKNKIYTDEN